MYIKSLVVDGFKSYAHRTEIDGFDTQFNAITGLNGSGKSNILDSICFVLGITNLSHVRASNLQDLVYKSGQAGVTKASVSIVFDNRVKDVSPIGYEQYDEITITRQIVIGGRNKYLINGTTAPNNRVHDLFHSVQLNVNNPHFLIMQGRITKVLNMKPPEILSLLEEAAGTKLYEAKKESALKTIEKKSSKLNEIQKLLIEEINPTITKLRQERSLYLEYQNILRRLEHLTKYVVAYEYKCLVDLQKQTVEELESIKEQITSLHEEIQAMAELKETLTTEIEQTVAQREELATEQFSALEAMAGEKQKEVAVVQGDVNRTQTTLQTEQKQKSALEKELVESEKLLSDKNKEIAKLSCTHTQLQERHTQAEQAVQVAAEQYEAVQQGLALADDGGASTLEEQLGAAEKSASAARSAQEQAELKLQHLRKEFQAKNGHLQEKWKRQHNSSGGNHLEKLEQQRQQLQADIASMEQKMASLEYSPEMMDQLDTDVRNCQREYRMLSQEASNMNGRFPNMTFHYQAPYADFDHSKVKGVAAKLFSVKESLHALALEVCAGGKLYNVIVECDKTSKALLERGQLQRRVTILPLNKIRGNPLPRDVLLEAQKLVGPDNVWDPLQLIDFDPALRPAMEFIFGGSLICRDIASARQVAFHRAIQKRTITLEGDTFDPQGTLTGGSRRQRANLLQQLAGVLEAERRAYECQQRLQKWTQQIDQARRVGEQWNRLQNDKVEKLHQQRMVESQLQQNELHELQDEVNAVKKDMEMQENLLKEAKMELAKSNEKIQSIKHKLDNIVEYREKARTDAAQRLHAAQALLAESENALRDKKAYFDTLTLETADVKKEIENIKESIGKAEANIVEAQANVEQAKLHFETVKEEMAQVKQKLKELKSQLDNFDKIIASKKKQLSETNDVVAASKLKITEFNYKVETHTKEKKDASNKLNYYDKQYAWIAEERHLFGMPDSAYDFLGAGSSASFEYLDPTEARSQMEKLKEKKEKLSRTVNMRAMNMLGRAEEQYSQLMTRRETVLKDKEIMEKFIDELDRKKNETLLKAFQQVNKDFGDIFTTLLPGTEAKLNPIKKGNHLEGLEFAIAFGGVWKESLNELSGGQRSLVALSLILSLLLFKPAPLYILDEVDAALDLSHTQNIGQLIKNHFQHSQFIIVSLKDGMFNNANVLFKTKFVDGMSTVTRHTNTKCK